MVRCTVSTVMGKRRMKIADVVRVTGLYRGTVTKLYYDRQERFTKDMLNKLCKNLNCQAHDLFEYIVDEENNRAR